jgi:hypothetical protein
VSDYHLKPMTRYLFPVRQLLASCCGEPSLTRRWVYNLLVQCFLAFPGQSLSGPSPVEFTTIFNYLILDSPTWRAKSPHSYPPGTGWPSYTHGHWVPFSSPLMTRRAAVEVFYLASQSYIMTNTMSVSPSWYQAPTWDPRPILPILDFILFFDTFGFIDVGALSDEKSGQYFSVFEGHLRSESHGTHEHSYCLHF